MPKNKKSQNVHLFNLTTTKTSVHFDLKWFISDLLPFFTVIVDGIRGVDVYNQKFSKATSEPTVAEIWKS